MKELNLIAVLGLCLICSPQAFGQNGEYFASRMVIEKPKETRRLQERLYKIYPFQKETSLIQHPTFLSFLIHDITVLGSYSTKPISVSIKQYSRPKIIEEAGLMYEL